MDNRFSLGLAVALHGLTVHDANIELQDAQGFGIGITLPANSEKYVH
ncbi:hypothetical protein ACSLBF_14055 [Pseudoalteromonas sp. T1lg65]